MRILLCERLLYIFDKQTYVLGICIYEKQYLNHFKPAFIFIQKREILKLTIAERLKEQDEGIRSLLSKTQASMITFRTGKDLAEASRIINESKYMKIIKDALANEKISEDERVILSEHMGGHIQPDPDNGLVRFAESLEQMATNPKYEESRKDYYTLIANACRELCKSDEFKEYTRFLRRFNKDTSPEANETKKMVELVRKKSQEIIKG